MFFSQESRRLNALFMQAVERREKHRLSAEYYSRQTTYLQVPQFITSTVSTTLSALHLSGLWVTISLPIIAVIATVLQGLPYVLRIDNKITIHQKAFQDYTNVINFLTYEYELNRGRTANFYPYAPLFSQDAIKKEIKIPIETEDEYKKYFYDTLLKLLDDSDNYDRFPQSIEDITIKVQNLIE